MGFRTQSLRERTTRALRPQTRGTTLRDRFELLMPLGRGGFGTVWEGFDMLLERPVAIKELVLDDIQTDQADALREARATARLNHPAIVSLYEVVAERDRIYMVNELVPGHTLSSMIAGRQLSDNDSGRIGYALCEALAHAHAQGVVHRDVKPANVMVVGAWLEGSGGWRLQPAKLMDFGIASIVDPGEHGGHAHAGPHAGSRGYAAPEQEAGHPATPASDVYSLALVLFECFAGSAPGRGRRSRLARVRRDLPSDLTWTLDQCLEPDPHLRPDVTEMAAVIHESLPDLSHRLAAPRIGARLSGLFARSAREGSGTVEPPRPVRSRGAAGPGPALAARLYRPAGAVIAALACVLTMLAAGLELSPLLPLVAGAAVLLMPRAGWALAAVGGIAGFALVGQIGSAMFMVPLALLAVLVAVVPLQRSIEGAVAGAGTLLWILAVQAISGVAPVLAMPSGIDQPEEIRRYADVALHSLALFAAPPYAAALALWALAGGVFVLLAGRGARMWVWTATFAALISAQIALGEFLGASPAATFVIAGSLAVLAAGGAAYLGTRTGRVLAADPGRKAARRPAAGHQRA